MHFAPHSDGGGDDGMGDGGGDGGGGGGDGGGGDGGGDGAIQLKHQGLPFEGPKQLPPQRKAGV